MIVCDTQATIENYFNLKRINERYYYNRSASHSIQNSNYIGSTVIIKERVYTYTENSRNMLLKIFGKNVNLLVNIHIKLNIK